MFILKDGDNGCNCFTIKNTKYSLPIFYLPHSAIIKTMATKIKNRIVGLSLVLFSFPVITFGQVVVPVPPTRGETIHEALMAVAGFLFWVATPVFAIVALISAFLMMTAGGNPEKFEKGKNALLYAIIAYGIILFATAIPAVLMSIIGNGGNGS